MLPSATPMSAAAALVPGPVEILGDDPEPDDEVRREVLQTTLIVQDFLASNHQKLRIVTHCGFPLRSPGKREGQPVRVPFYYRFWAQIFVLTRSVNFCPSDHHQHVGGSPAKTTTSAPLG
jgi:hypothetical protein